MGKGADTKDRITQAAKSLLSVHGYMGTTIEDIITASGITKGAFYHHFKSKDELCATIIDKLSGQYQELIDSLPSTAEPIDRLRAMLERLAQLNSQGQWVNCRLVIKLSLETQQGQAQLHEKLTNFWKWYTDFLDDLIMQCRSRGQIKTNVSPKIQTHVVLNLMAGSIMLGNVTGAGPKLEDITEAIISTLQS